MRLPASLFQTGGDKRRRQIMDVRAEEQAFSLGRFCSHCGFLTLDGGVMEWFAQARTTGERRVRRVAGATPRVSR